MAVFTPHPNFVALSNLVEQELLRIRPFGLNAFTRTYEYSRLLGPLVAFVGLGSDRSTSLTISYGRPSDPRATDAITCCIARAEKLIFLSHYLTSRGIDSSFLSNSKRLPSEEFIVSGIRGLDVLSGNAELAPIFDGSEMIDVPYDYGNSR